MRRTFFVLMWSQLTTSAHVLLPATIVLISGLAVPAAADLRYENGSGGSALLYGQFDPALLSFDDGVSTTGDLVNNDNSNSRIGFWLRQDYGANTLSFNFEIAVGFSPSSGLSQTVTPQAFDWQLTGIRKVDFSYETASFGTFYIGQGSMATDGVAEVDLSGTTIATTVSIPDTAGSFVFRTTAGALSGVAIGNVFLDLDGYRRRRIRYDSPSFSGFMLALAYGEEIFVTNSNDKYADIALRYAGKVGDVQLQGAVGFSRGDRSGVDTNDTFGSLSMLHGSGVNVTIAAGDRKGGGSYTYGKLGYKANWFPVGQTALSVDYYRGRNFNTAGSRSGSFGFGAVQSFDKANIEAYLGYREYSLTETVATYRDASSVLFGARWKF